MMATRRTTILATSLISKPVFFLLFFLSHDNDMENREEQPRFNLMDLAGEHKEKIG